MTNSTSSKGAPPAGGLFHKQALAPVSSGCTLQGARSSEKGNYRQNLLPGALQAGSTFPDELAIWALLLELAHDYSGDNKVLGVP